jgi:hypothetical protein
VFATGCGNQYRPVVTATNPVGPAGQPQKYAVVISNPSTPTEPAVAGLLTFVDFAGDTITSTPSIQSNPNYIALTGSGSEGFTINAAGALDSFGSANPAALITSNIATTTLAPSATPVSISPISLAGSTATVFVPEPGLGRTAGLTNAGVLVQDVSIPNAAAGAGPVYVVGADGTPRVYALSTAAGGGGIASSIESSTAASGLAVTATLPVGANPVYGVMTADARRAFILNKGSQSVSVINVVNNALDTTTALPTGTINLQYKNPVSGAVTTDGMNPVWADLSPITNELAVVSAGDGTNPGLLTIINIPLCNAQTQTGSGSSACDPTNPVDGNGFGTILLQVPLGINPSQVSILGDGTRAYISNSGVLPSAGVTEVPGSVSVVNMLSGTVTATFATSADNAANLSAGTVFGLHPNTIITSNSSPTGKVYVTASDSRYLTVIYTDTDTVVTHVPIQGTGVRVVVNQK